MCAREGDGPEREQGANPGAQGETGMARWLRGFSARRASMGSALRSYGLAAVIAYGLFDACTYGVSLLLAMRAYVAAGKVVTTKTLPQVLAIMWGINNFSRPFRIAGALALAPIVDARGMFYASGFCAEALTWWTPAFDLYLSLMLAARYLPHLQVGNMLTSMCDSTLPIAIFGFRKPMLNYHRPVVQPLFKLMGKAPPKTKAIDKNQVSLLGDSTQANDVLSSQMGSADNE
jgi:hypothetical protein